MKRFACLVPLGMLAACAAAEMEMPASLAAGGERVVFENMSGWNHGRFVAGAYAGGYERTLDRASFGGFTETDGRGSFVIEGPGISRTIEGYCWVREHALTFADIEIKPGKMAYRCDFEAEGNPIPAYFELQESRASLAENLNRNARVGEIGLAGEVVRFRSVHRIVGGKLPTADPMGYVFEQDGEAIGALELNGKPVLTLAPGADLDRRRAMVVAAVALATFWDPAVVGDS